MSNQENTQENQKNFTIQKLFVKDVSFESPNSPAIFTDQNWQPELNVQLNTEHNDLGNNHHEVVLDITVTAKQGEKTGFLIELKQAGVFSLEGFAAEEMGPMLGSYCPNILFPYAREAISDYIGKGGFPAILLAPVNFDALYAQHVQQQQKQAADNTAH